MLGYVAQSGVPFWPSDRCSLLSEEDMPDVHNCVHSPVSWALSRGCRQCWTLLIDEAQSVQPRMLLKSVKLMIPGFRKDTGGERRWVSPRGFIGVSAPSGQVL